MAGEGERGEGSGFRVNDRRRFSPETGEPREQTETGEPAGSSGAKPAPEENREAADQPLPEISFSALVISLSTQALMHLGEIPNPISGKVEKDISVAKQMIDIIGVLGEKTRGNLDQGEDKLMEEVLYDLRMRYVEAAKKK